MPERTLKRFLVNPRYCKGCEICVALCPKKIISMKGKVPVVEDPSQCTMCLMCETHCPDLAIGLEAADDE